MSDRKKYIKKSDTAVVAVQLNLDFEGFAYHKWGHDQRCSPGDWLVDNGGDVYTVDQEVFRNTYQQVSPGNYKKVKPIWAEVADESGVVKTIEGQTSYEAGDYLIADDRDGPFTYSVSPGKFESMYELAD